jgi:hypothetical protein
VEPEHHIRNICRNAMVSRSFVFFSFIWILSRFTTYLGREVSLWLVYLGLGGIGTGLGGHLPDPSVSGKNCHDYELHYCEGY